MKILMLFVSFSSLVLFSSMTFAQEAGDAVKLEYGKVESKQTVQAKGERGAGTMAGGVAGAALAKDHRGLGALAGGLLGGGIQKHQTRDTLEQYTVALVSGGRVVIDTEQEDIIVGDCVVVEKGKYANIRRVGSINCQVKQQPAHHAEAASNCQKAKDELNKAKTDDEVHKAVIKVKTLCED